ncbi:unnamed protein product [Dovyalis caffra]|uniref:Uncharacterized protein n=1 Tax=Dovyalis caffra TaxID=77055 RepID=A0AAV1SKD7_9ROSI|nr:unnamed protein product [Dovyalis caffra]
MAESGLEDQYGRISLGNEEDEGLEYNDNVLEEITNRSLTMIGCFLTEVYDDPDKELEYGAWLRAPGRSSIMISKKWLRNSKGELLNNGGSSEKKGIRVDDIGMTNGENQKIRHGKSGVDGGDGGRNKRDSNKSGGKVGPGK